MKAIKYNGKDYVEVKERILFLKNEFDGDYSIKTKYKFYPEAKTWVVKATLTLMVEGKEFKYTGHAQEVEGSSFVNKTSALENAETSAVGRACAMAGIGIIDGIASIDEINKAVNRSQDKKLEGKLDEYAKQHTKKASDMPDSELPWMTEDEFHRCIEAVKTGNANAFIAAKQKRRIKKTYREEIEAAIKHAMTA